LAIGDFSVDNGKIAEAISLLTSVYNTPNEKIFAKAKALVEGAARTHNYIIPVRADKVKKEEIVIGGSPFSGKTHLAVWLSCRYPGKTVAYFFREDATSDMQKYYRIAGGFKKLSQVWLIKVKDYVFTAQTVEQGIETLAKAGNKPDIVVIDHLDIMQSVFRARADWEDASTVINESKVMAERQEVLAIVLSQLNERTREVKGTGRFYRAKTAKAMTPDFIFFIDDVQGEEYRVSRLKWKGRDLSPDTSSKVLLANWSTMQISDVT
jgi:nucleoside-triphosphatase THEP1